MRSRIIIRLHPVEPISGDDFTDYLDDLTITAHEASFNDPDASEGAVGAATYIAPELPEPSDEHEDIVPEYAPETRIVQHYHASFDGEVDAYVIRFYAVATAVIEIPDPPDHGEYQTADVRLVITRGDNDFVHKQVYYNVPVAPGPIPEPVNPNDFPVISDPSGNPIISLHLALPSPGQQLSSTVIVPEDGTAPNFGNLRTAVENVLTSEPGDTTGIANLTRDQCRHIAYEIIWDRMAYPLPVPKRPLESMYTGPHDDPSSADERDRRLFEGDLLTYYVKHNNEADRLANFIFSLSAAIWCEEKSREATQVGFYFPVFPNSPEREAKVILKGIDADPPAPLDPVFEVPAAYFYTLAAILPPQINPEQRFKMATSDAEGQSIAIIEQAFDDQILTEPILTTPGDVNVNIVQAARRLRALGAVGEVGTPPYEVVSGSPAPAHGLIGSWLASIEADINEFWKALSLPNDFSGHLDLLLCAITKAHEPLVSAIEDPVFEVNNVDALAKKNSNDWKELLSSDSDPPVLLPELLPEFTKPGTAEERFEAFILHLRSFFDVASVFDPPEPADVDTSPGLGRPAGNPLDALLSAYPGFTFSSWDSRELENALNSNSIFPDDPEAQEQFTEWLTCIQGLLNLANGISPDVMQFSVMEALWARGFTNAQSIQDFSSADFKEALVGSVAFEYAQTIRENAGATEPTPAPGPEGFQPVNPDGTIVNCVPPKHLSPLGPVAYLRDLLSMAKGSTCDSPLPYVNKTLTAYLTPRRGQLDQMLATKANTGVPIPLIDIVNESLEQMVIKDMSSFVAVYNTASDQVANHVLTSNADPEEDAYLHDPETLLEALPEHSTPATPTVEQAAYDTLKSDFSACNLPYSQPLDVSRTYLKQLGSSRFATMRRFRKDITEFVLDPANETAEFQKHLWRYPVRIETAIEYLGITPEEYSALLEKPISNAVSPPDGNLALYQLYGFPEQMNDGEDWTKIVIRVSEFLERTCLTYCEFLELWKSEFVKFGLKDNLEVGFPDCEPCCLEKYLIEFIDPDNLVQALKRLIVFIRLWRKLQAVPNARYAFTELRDICEVLQLFTVRNNVNPDFIRQLAAFQMFRDDFELSLTDGTQPEEGDTGAERLHLLSFWSPGASKWNWALEHLLDQIQQYVMITYSCGCREPEFIKLLKNNLNPLSALAGFAPSNPDDTWHTRPTHTLRFAEILEKIYASEFRVGELLFLFTSDEHLQGDDPFPLQTANEAKDSPLGLPDDEDQNSLWALRNKLLAIEVSAEVAAQWSWARMETVLREEFGFAPPSGDNKWLSLGQHFFPETLADSGIAVSISKQQYRVSLTSTTSERMWNTPLDGPFHYDAEAKELWPQVPLTDEAVLAKLSRIRQLRDPEQSAVRDLYFLPRLDLAHFAFIFNNFGEAEERLLQEPDEAKRWVWFQQEFARFYQCCQVIVEHLAMHTNDVTNNVNPEGIELVKLLLKNLWADENMATAPWEDNDGQSPAVTWQPQPKGGAFAALLGLTGRRSPGGLR